MQNYKEINGNDYVKDSRTTINETMQSIQSMNSGTVFPANNLFEGMKCYRTDLKKTYTLTDVENNTWVEDAHAELSDEATHAASTTKLQTPRALNLSGAVTADAASFDGTADATINVKTLDASKLKGTASVSTTGNAATASKLLTPRTISLTGKAAGSTTFDGSSNASINVTSVNADTATTADNSNKLGGYPLNTEAVGGQYNTVPLVNAVGVMEIGKYIDWHATSGDTEDYSSRWTAETDETVSVGTINGTLKGNAATASKLLTPRTISLTGKAAGSTTFDGSSNASINVTSVNADTASKLSTARKINITGNATGAATFDGTSDVSINVSVSQAAHADKATQDTNGRAFTDTNAYMHISALVNNTDFNNVKTTGIYYCTGNKYPNRPRNSCGILTVYSIGTVKQEYRPDNAAVYYTRVYDNGSWNAWSKVNAANADTAAACSGNSATATKLQTPRAISLTGNATGSANFDGSGNVSINTTVSQAERALIANNLNSGADAGSITINQSGYSDYSPTVGGNYANMNISSWFGVSFTSQCGGSVPRGKTAVGIDCREGIVRANMFEGTLNGNASSADSATNASLISPFEIGTANVFRSVWFSDSDANNKASYNPNIQYNPSTNVLKVGTVQGNLAGNADSATNADKLDGYHASDIINRISAANTGGIVAASLTENGYAKFANGLILQWGNAKGNDEEDNYTTFPIAFPSTCFVVLLTSKSYIFNNGLRSQSKTGFTWAARSGLISWAALGM